MNIFEDLIDELREENLLEQTAMPPGTPNKNPVAANAAKKREPAAEILEAEILEAEAAPEPEFLRRAEISSEFEDSDEVDSESAESFEDAAERKKAEADFYRKRAMNEVSFLQMVEYVFAGVEREQLKAVPKPYDDLEVKKVLHSFLQNADDPQSPEHAKAQFQLLRETEKWHSSLSRRDARLMTAHLRRFCETSRPPLGSPALVALARFYRNSAYSEAVRSKFDLVVTRLFSKEAGGSRRETIFEREELARHLTDLYADWSSVSTYPTETDDETIAEIARTFESLMREAENAFEFDDLIGGDFFNRLHSFKESVNANFFAPPIAAIAVETNIYIGNRYVELLESEKERASVADLESKYGFSHDQTVSEATGKTFALIELLNQKAVEPPVEEKVVDDESVSVKEKNARRAEESASPNDFLTQLSGLSLSAKYLIGAAAVFLLIAVVYFASGSGGPDISKKTPSANARKLALENSMLKEHLKEASVDDDTLMGVVAAAWINYGKDKRMELVTQMLNLGKEKGYSKVHLVDESDTLVAAGAGEKIYVKE